MNNYKYEENINNRNGYFYVYYEGSLEKKIDFIELERKFNNYLKNLDFDRELDKIIGDIRTIFREFKELKLIINCKNKKKDNYYEVCYCDKELFKYTNNSSHNDIKSNFKFDYIRGISFDIQQNFMIINSPYNNENINIYLDRIKELCNLKSIGINEITNEMLYINEIYKLFYGRYPNYNSKNINLKIQNMIYILSEYGVNFVKKYYFSNNNEKKIPFSKELDDLINIMKTYGVINSDIIIDKKYKEIIKIIKKTINNSKNKDIDFDSVTTCLSMVLYATKYNLKLGYTLDGVTERLDCTKAAAERGIKLYKNINRNMYEKN